MPTKTSFKPILFMLIGGVLILVGVEGRVLLLDQRTKQDVKGLTSETVDTPTPFPTVAFNQTLEETPTETVDFIPTRKPMPTLMKNSPTPTLSQQPTIQVQYVPVTHAVNQNIQTNSQDDEYIKYLREQQNAIQEKRAYCEQLYSEVTASIQPLYSQRDAINKNYSEAIAMSNVSKIGQYQQELASVQAQIDAYYNQNYYSVCP